ncbi:D-beta-D-heptose 1-phosphate adenosyltransferase [Actinoplanes sp. ATCC 53533]|uniref:PfkB family carbohydrate kinase n=1 Tax=Actinoplanes sp. ATCC 53533 TaxID=1288362 RepID=UPI000F76A4CD|nr:PfkB family carbohydrate kinase [Actinoplanes sp. ATCC 53533]RSM38189.1 D-beta-D-heptose 1-phosphate adenosyltransferase [Actinoplanes sp. ATCC 53533]
MVVVGDTLLDRDIVGSVHRVTPDAPALVLDEKATTSRPGGAGLAARLAAGRGFDVALITAIADDSSGALLNELLTSAGIEVYPLPLPGGTPEKIRMCGNGQVLLRLDRGGATVDPAEQVSRTALELLQEATAILVSDYGRGVTGHPQLRDALEQTRAPIVWDPHPNGAPPVPGVQLVTPSAAEARTLSGDTSGGSTLAAAQRAGNLLLQRWQAGAIAITVGPDGAIVCQGSPIPVVIPAPTRATGDACGAGDQFAATAALALAGGALVSEAVQEAVSVATAYVKAGGVNTVLNHATPSAERPTNINCLLSEVRGRGGTVVATGGCFDLLHVGHLATLEAARRLGDCLIVCLNSDESVRGIKGPGRPLTTQADRSRILAALDCVDAVVIFDEPNPEAILSWLRPDIWVKGGDYTELAEANLIRQWGGQAVTVPYLDGRSTSHTIAVARSDRSSKLGHR